MECIVNCPKWSLKYELNGTDRWAEVIETDIYKQTLLLG